MTYQCLIIFFSLCMYAEASINITGNAYFEHTSPHFTIKTNQNNLHYVIKNGLGSRIMKGNLINKTLIIPLCQFETSGLYSIKIENQKVESEPFYFTVKTPENIDNVQIRLISENKFHIMWPSKLCEKTTYKIFGGHTKDGPFKTLVDMTSSNETIVDTEFQFYQIRDNKNQTSKPVSILDTITYTKPAHIPQKKWDTFSPYFLPESHPAKPVLDKIFKNSRANISLKHLKKAGFKASPPMKWTHLVVARHSETPGFIYKIYLDSQRVFNKITPENIWIQRITGANLIRDELKKKDLEDTFKVPRKWIYPLPAKPSPPKEFYRKDFILVVDDMEILNDKENEAKWKSNAITEEILTNIYSIAENLGLYDSTKPNNIPFSYDGKIAFVDTQVYNKWPVKYYKLTPHLSPSMKTFWKSLIK